MLKFNFMPTGSKQELLQKMDFDTKTLRRILENCSYRDWRMLRFALQRTDSEEEECSLAPVEKFKIAQILVHAASKGWLEIHRILQ